MLSVVIQNVVAPNKVLWIRPQAPPRQPDADGGGDPAGCLPQPILIGVKILLRTLAVYL